MGTGITALAALTLAVFSIGTTEFIVPGLLPEISSGLNVTIPEAGLLVTGYAAGVAIGGPILVLLTNRLSRRATLLALVAIFVAGHALAALAPTYSVLMVARVITSFCHGAFVGVASVVAMHIVPPERRATAVAVVWVGFCLATIVGVPVGTALGQALGWRTTLAIVGALGLIAGVGIAAFVPKTVAVGTADLKSELAVLKRPQLLIALAMSILIATGTLAVFTYVVPFLTDVTGIAKERVPAVLFAFGVGGTIGMFVGARFADWKLMPTTVAIFIALALIYVALLVVQTNAILTIIVIFAWGFFVYAPAAPIQVRIVNVASDGPSLASTLNQSAFNVGNALGPFLGAVMLSQGASYGALPWLGVAMLTLGAGLGVLAMALER